MVRFTQSEICLLDRLYRNWVANPRGYLPGNEFCHILDKYQAEYDGINKCLFFNGPGADVLGCITEVYELAQLLKTLEDEHYIFFVDNSRMSAKNLTKITGSGFGYNGNNVLAQLDITYCATIDKCFNQTIIVGSTFRTFAENNYTTFEEQLLKNVQKQYQTSINSLKATRGQAISIGELLNQAKKQTAETKKQTDLAIDSLGEAKKQTKEAAAQSFEARKQTQQAFLQTRQALKQTEEAKEQTHQALYQTEQAQLQTEEARKQSSQALMQTEEALKQTKEVLKQTIESKTQTKEALKQTKEALKQTKEALKQTKEANKQSAQSRLSTIFSFVAMIFSFVVLIFTIIQSNKNNAVPHLEQNNTDSTTENIDTIKSRGSNSYLQLLYDDQDKTIIPFAPETTIQLDSVINAKK